MTIITQTRWKCDYEPCGVLSPVLTRIDPLIDIKKDPLGWSVAKKTRNVEDSTIVIEETKHFCHRAHKDKWNKERSNE